jgi:hypothetical protein
MEEDVTIVANQAEEDIRGDDRTQIMAVVLEAQATGEILGDHVLHIIVERIRKDVGTIAKECVVIEEHRLFSACGQYAIMGAKFYLAQLRFRFEIGNRGSEIVY